MFAKNCLCKVASFPGQRGLGYGHSCFSHLLAGVLLCVLHGVPLKILRSYNWPRTQWCIQFSESIGLPMLHFCYPSCTGFLFWGVLFKGSGYLWYYLSLRLSAYPSRSDRVGRLQVPSLKSWHLAGSWKCIFSMADPTLWKTPLLVILQPSTCPPRPPAFGRPLSLGFLLRC